MCAYFFGDDKLNIKYMELAYKEAEKAFKKENVPVGAVIVKNNKVIAKAHNKKNDTKISTHHAEILAIEKACKKLGDWRLDGCELYVTLKPSSLRESISVQKSSAVEARRSAAARFFSETDMSSDSTRGRSRCKDSQ